MARWRWAGDAAGKARGGTGSQLARGTGHTQKHREPIAPLFHIGKMYHAVHIHVPGNRSLRWLLSRGPGRLRRLIEVGDLAHVVLSLGDGRDPSRSLNGVFTGVISRQ